MSLIVCSQGHENPVDSRFCRFCGEQLVPAPVPVPGPASGTGEGRAPQSLAQSLAQSLVGLRYRVSRQLGSGGFGRTYLAEDVQRFNEPCVLKEFAPQVEGAESIRKAEVLFEREAGVLYRLRHAQIPRFRELLRAEFEGRDRLFLVQDYIDGPTYQDLLDRRMERDRPFSEPEIMQFLSQILPVLGYIHRAGVIHRDIAPDNLILREEDQMPVLIDFGGVKQAAVTVVSELGKRRPAPDVTLVGKQGFAPREQMQTGDVQPHCDLYALAVTVLVLMTGQAPRELLAAGSPSHWSRQVQLSPALRSTLTRMLSDRPQERFASAQDVLQSLGLLRTVPVQPAAVAPPVPVAAAAKAPAAPAAPPPSTTTARTVAVAPGAPRQAAAPLSGPTIPVGRGGKSPAIAPPAAPAAHESGGSAWWQGIVAFFVIVALAGVGGWVGYRWVPEWMNLGNDNDAAEQANDPVEVSSADLNADQNSQVEAVSSRLPAAEQARKEALRSRQGNLGVDTSFLVALTNDEFYQKYPGQRGRELTENPDDAEWRERWDAIAASWLDQMENSLSPAARRKLGSYSQADRDRWRQIVNRLHVSSDALYDLTDARFFRQFPDQQDEDFLEQPIGQIWHAMGADQVDAMEAGQTLETIQFAQGETEHEASKSLDPGEGQVYTLNLAEGQEMRLKLEAPRDVRWSVYVPSPTEDLPYLLEDSKKSSWLGELPQSGYYEVAIVSVAEDDPVEYRLSISVKD